MTFVKIHPFEAAGMGQAPFRFVGYERKAHVDYPGATPRPGSSCDYCGTAIMDVFMVRSADGREFKVGCDCIRKVYAEFDADIPVDARKAIARMQRQQREASRMAKFEKASVRRNATRETLAANPDWFVDQPHPFAGGNAFFAEKTLRDYYEYLLQSGGVGGWDRVAKIIEARAAQATDR